jgi:hypothetical protein
MRLVFNFGEYSFQYKYPDYDKIDIPRAVYTGMINCTIKYLELLDNHFFKLLTEDQIKHSFKKEITWKIFYFLSHTAFNDNYLLQEIIIPYLININEENYSIFLENLINVPEYSQNSISNLINGISYLNIVLCSEIEKKGLSEGDVKEWSDRFILLQKLLNNDNNLLSWISTERYKDSIKNIFNFDHTRLKDLYGIYYNKRKISKDTTLIRNLVLEVCEEFESTNNPEEVYSCKVFIGFIKFVLNIDKYGSSNRSLTLKKIIFDEYFKQIKLDPENIFSYETSLNLMFSKNFYFNILSYFLDEISDNYETYSPEAFYNRKDKDSLYKDELGIGGTISHVVNEYDSKIDGSLKEKINTIENYLFHRILKITTSYIFSVLREIRRDIESLRNESIVALNENNGLPKMQHFRNIVALFTKRNKFVNHY